MIKLSVNGLTLNQPVNNKAAPCLMTGVVPYRLKPNLIIEATFPDWRILLALLLHSFFILMPETHASIPTLFLNVYFILKTSAGF